jgi:hypothetical protein
VPQGSVFGSLKFVSYTKDVTPVFKRHNIIRHLLNDDKQAYASATLQGVDDVRCRLPTTVTDAHSICFTQREYDGAQQVWKAFPIAKLADMHPTVTTDVSVIKSAAVVRNIGVLLSQELSTKPHITKKASSCFYQLWRICRIRRPVGQELVAQLIHSFILSRLDYGNSRLADQP